MQAGAMFRLPPQRVMAKLITALSTLCCLLRDLLLARDSISSQRECPTKRSVKSGKRKA